MRSVEWAVADPGTLVVQVTPTYSGCPATELIMAAIREALADARRDGRQAGDAAVAGVDHRLDHPGARQKLREYGIAPPERCRGDGGPQRIDVAGISPLRRATVVVGCPRCGSARTTLVAQFGSTACKAQYRCLDCLEPFDYFKPH